MNAGYERSPRMRPIYCSDISIQSFIRNNAAWRVRKNSSGHRLVVFRKCERASIATFGFAVCAYWLYTVYQAVNSGQLRAAAGQRVHIVPRTGLAQSLACKRTEMLQKPP